MCMIEFLKQGLSKNCRSSRFKITDGHRQALEALYARASRYEQAHSPIKAHQRECAQGTSFFQGRGEVEIKVIVPYREDHGDE